MELRGKHHMDGRRLEEVRRIIRHYLGDLAPLGGARELAADLGDGGQDRVVAQGLLLQVVRAQVANSIEVGRSRRHDAVEHDPVYAVARFEAAIPEDEPACMHRVDAGLTSPVSRKLSRNEPACYHTQSCTL